MTYRRKENQGKHIGTYRELYGHPFVEPPIGMIFFATKGLWIFDHSQYALI